MTSIRWILPLGFVGLLACGSTSPITAASHDAAQADAAPADAGPSEAGVTKSPPDPGQLACGNERCTTPGELCCYSSIAPAGAPDHCATSIAQCGAPNIACDETGDCAAGSVCCTGVAVLPKGASVSGFEAAACQVEAPASCIETQGVGSSSVQVCKTDAECRNGKPCVLQSCHGRALQTCGRDAQCK